MTLSDKLQLLRKTNAMTQDVLAEKLGVSRQAIAKWESGMAYPDIMNLIGLSELFHITIDYLVKDNSCEKVILRSEDTDLDALIAFKLDASKNTYAGYADTVPSCRPGSHDYQYQSGDFLYYDSWFGGERFTGEEVIWKSDIPLYSMNYFGHTLDERFSGDFLKEALRLGTIDLPYRGPEYYQAGEYTYKNKTVGKIEWFQGFEEIYCQNDLVYECTYHGGIL